MAQLESLLSQIDSGSMLLPEFQRGYVWNRDQVRGLLRSLYLGYPVGGLLVWGPRQIQDCSPVFYLDSSSFPQCISGH